MTLKKYYPRNHVDGLQTMTHAPHTENNLRAIIQSHSAVCFQTRPTQRPIWLKNVHIHTLKKENSNVQPWIDHLLVVLRRLLVIY